MYGYKLGLKKVGESVPAAPVNVVQPLLTGNGAVGTVVTCSNGSWTGSPSPTFSFNFRVNGISVQNGASNTYTPLIGDDTKTLTCLVTATNTQGSASEGASNSLVVGTIPNNTVAPTVSPSGTQSTGTLITANVGTWAGTATIVYEYKWTRNGVAISGATASTYTIQSADDGTTIRVEVKGSNAYGESSFIVSSNSVSAVNAVAPSNTVAPVISGTAVVGQVLTSTTGTWTGIPTPTYSYQWKRGATNIGTNSSTYTLVAADAGNTSIITCVVTATNSAGSANATSNTIAQILTVRTNSFLTASAISDATIRGGLNTFDIGLIANSLDTKMKAVYPFVGGTASTHKFNFMNSADTDAAFRILFNGTVTHTSNGVQGNGTNGFLDTRLNTSTNLTKTSAHLSLYIRNNPAVPVGRYDMGNALDPAMGSNPTYLIARYNTGSAFFGLADSSYGTGAASTNSTGFWNGATNGGTTQVLYRNGTSYATGTAAAGAFANNNLYIAAANGGGTTVFFTDRQYAFSSIGDGLSGAQASTFYTLVQALQTTLGRQV
jgi:hypothetical protein